jgi:hypothetical protein
MKISRLIFAWIMCAAPALAGPPYVTDDPEPTDPGHYEIYLFSDGATLRGDWGGSGGIDFNYGAAPDLQLTAVLPVAWDDPDDGPHGFGLSNVELAAKYKFLHQDDVGVDVAFFPRVFLPAGSPEAGERHTSLLLPIWIQHAWDKWTTFGGGGCEIDHGGDSQNFCMMGWVVTTQLTQNFQIGAEIYHQTADTKGGRASTGVNFGAIYDLNDNFHLMASVGPGLQNAAETGETTWYTALLLTF